VVNAQSAASLREDGASMRTGHVLDGVKPAAAAFRDDPFENKKVSLARCG
jgi:hypothetical protein